MNDVVIAKHHRPAESFDPVKLHESIAAACLAVRAFEGEAQITAERVCKAVLSWLLTKSEVTSADVRRVAARHLALYDPEAAYMYEHHRMII